MEFGVWGLELARLLGLVLRVQGVRVQGLGFRVWGSGFSDLGSLIWGWCSGLREW